MDMFKNFGERAKDTAKIVGEKSSDLVEIGKYKIRITQLESDIRRLKTDIGQYFYDTYANRVDLAEEEIVKACEEIKEKYEGIADLESKIERTQKY